MKCRNCKEEMMDGVTVCPACGSDNAAAAKKTRTMIIAAVCCVALVIGVVAMVFGMTDPNKDRITSRVSYIVSDDVAKSKADKVIATAGEFELTNGELQVLYWSMVYELVDYLGEYATLYIDFTKPLSEQYFNENEGITWEHYFLEMALANWLRYEALTAESELAGVVLDAEMQSRLDNLYQNMEEDLKDTKFTSVEEMVRNDFGNAATFKDFESYMEIYIRGNFYYSHLYSLMEVSDAEMEEYYKNNEQTLVSRGYGKEVGSAVEAMHILISPADESPEALDAAKKKAQDIMEQWAANGATEAEFAELAKTHSSCPSGEDGGYLGSFTKGQMVKEFEDWCFADGHEYGDYGLVQTQHGWHIIFYVDGYAVWEEACRSGVANQKRDVAMQEIEQKYPMTVQFKDIALANVPLV